MTNTVQRFIFEDLDIRGAFVRLDTVWHKLLEKRNYPTPVVDLLGQMCATTLLMADNLKQPGRLTIQLRGEGPVSLLVIDCAEDLNLRCLAQHREQALAMPLVDLLGAGQFVLTLASASRREPYQSIVPLSGSSIAEVFEHYLKQSEQIASRFFLAASADATAGLFLQKVPSTDKRDADGWSRVEALAATAKPEELLGLPTETLLTRLFHEETVRVFAAREVKSDFPEDWEKIGNMLRALGREAVYANLNERGVIVIRDDLANHEYRFDKAAIDALFSNTPTTPPTVH
jgi:molecular chaperone Hsp33